MTDPTGTDRQLRGPSSLDALAFDDDGLLPVVAQDAGTGRVLMVAWAGREALERSLSTGEMHFWSRSRGELWRKGETSGNVLRVRSLHADCDGDTVLALVDPTGPACHTGEPTCFGAGAAPRGSEEGAVPLGTGDRDGPEAGPGRDHDVHDGPEAHDVPGVHDIPDVLGGLWTVIGERARERPEGSYTARLLDDENLRLKKLGEEAAELIVEAARHEPAGVAREAADLVYHAMVVLRGAGSSWDDVLEELARRRR